MTIRVSSGARSVTSIVESIRRQHEVMARTVKTFSHPFGESSISVELARIDRERRLMFEGPLFSVAGQAREMLRSMRFPLLTTQLAEEMRRSSGVESARMLSESLAGPLRALESFRCLTVGLDHFRDMQVPDLGRIAVLDDAILGSVALRSAIESAQVPLSPSVQKLIEGLDRLDTAAGNIWAMSSAKPAAWMRLPPGLRDMPALELLEASRSTASAAGVQNALEEEPAGDELLGSTLEVDLGSRLASVDEDLAEMYRGALEAFERQGADWPRQVSASLREIIAILLRRFAPRSNVFAWNPDAKRTPNGEPTRDERIRYLLRSVDAGYTRYAEVDNDHIQQTAIFLVRAVHRPKTEISRRQFQLLIRRCQFTFHFLLDTQEL